MSGIQRLQAKRDKLLVLAKKKRIINAKTLKIKNEKAALQKEIRELKVETNRDIIKMIKKKVTSPESKRTFRRAKSLFRSIQKGINALDKRIN